MADKSAKSETELRSSQRSEKILIDCTPNKSMINFDESSDSDKNEETFNKLVRNQLIMEFSEMNDFLDEIGMTVHIEKFLSHNIDSLDKIYEGKFDIFNLKLLRMIN